MRGAVHEHLRQNEGISALTITVIYLLSGGLWILFSDRLLHAFITDAALLLELQTFKGWFFVAATGFMLHTLIGRSSGAMLKANLEMRRNEEYLQTVINTIPALVFVTDTDDRLLRFNDLFARVTSQPSEQVVGKTCTELFRFADPETHCRNDMEIIRTGKPKLHMIERIKTDEGSRWFEISKMPLTDEGGKVQGLIGFAVEITDRKLAEDALRESQSLLQSILDNAPVSIFVKDLEGRYQLVNRSFEVRCNLSGAEMLGRTDYDCVPTEEADRYRRHDHEVLEANSPIEHEDVVNLGGATHTYIAVKFPLMDLAGAPYAICGISTDITERKLAEEQLRASREQLRALSARLLSAREEERKSIAREIHDELGQALTGLIIELSWLEDKLALLPDREQARSLLDKTASMLRLADSTVESVRRIAAELRPGLLDDFGLVAAIEWHAQEFEQRTGVICRVSSDLDETALTPEQATALFRIAQEALTNVARHASANTVQVRILRDGDVLVLSVEDDGSGINEEKRSSARSLGVIGMRERATLLGGSVQISGPRGGGTRVVARVPVGAGAAEAA